MENASPHLHASDLGAVVIVDIVAAHIVRVRRLVQHRLLQALWRLDLILAYDDLGIE